MAITKNPSTERHNPINPISITKKPKQFRLVEKHLTVWLVRWADKVLEQV